MGRMDTQKVIEIAREHLGELSGHIFDLLTVTKPLSNEAAVNLSKIVSKLSPLVGNLIEFNTVEFLNDQEEFSDYGQWLRQDPGFPDTIFHGSISPTPGFEIKAWFPLATEITARFKDSQNHFKHDQTYVAMLAWLPDSLIYGKPKILDVLVVSGLSVAKARDDHYHNPPDYLVLEPEDTSDRTSNLQQTNTNGYKFQGTPEDLKEAQQLVDSWGPEGMSYKPTREYQEKLRELIGRYTYRLDTNFAKMNRIEHPEINEFKHRVYNTVVHGMTVNQWRKVLGSSDAEKIKHLFQDHIDITEEDSEDIIL